MQEEKFYGDEREEIECALKACMAIYDVSKEDMRLLIQTDADNGGVVYWGYTFERLSPENEERLEQSVTELSYKDYCGRCNSWKEKTEITEKRSSETRSSLTVYGWQFILL
mgnify:CR=1 FL=1